MPENSKFVGPYAVKTIPEPLSLRMSAEQWRAIVDILEAKYSFAQSDSAELLKRRQAVEFLLLLGGRDAELDVAECLQKESQAKDIRRAVLAALQEARNGLALAEAREAEEREPAH